MLRKMVKQRNNESNAHYRRRIRRIRYSIRESIAAMLCMVIMGVIMMWMTFSWLSKDTGYYKYNDGAADGTGVYYEWVMANEK